LERSGTGLAPRSDRCTDRSRQEVPLAEPVEAWGRQVDRVIPHPSTGSRWGATSSSSSIPPTSNLPATRNRC